MENFFYLDVTNSALVPLYKESWSQSKFIQTNESFELVGNLIDKSQEKQILKEEKPKEINITLTTEEAKSLYCVLIHVGGAPRFKG